MMRWAGLRDGAGRAKLVPSPDGAVETGHAS